MEKNKLNYKTKEKDIRRMIQFAKQIETKKIMITNKNKE